MHKSVDVLAERSIQEQLDQLRQFYIDKGIDKTIDKTGNLLKFLLEYKVTKLVYH